MRWLHRYATPLQLLVTIGLYAQLSALYGVSAFPSLYLLVHVWEATAGFALWSRLLLFSITVFGAFFAFAVVLVVVVGLFRLITFAGTPLGRFSYYSLAGFRWASYNALILAVRFTVMDFMRVTPLLPFFHRLMGMKLGARVQINTKVIGDANLIEVGDDTVIGGDATVVCHSAEAGKLVTAPVKIGSRVTIGLMAVILPGCEIGDNAIIAANAILPKGTRVPANTVWAGIPAKQVAVRGARKEETKDATPG